MNWASLGTAKINEKLAPLVNSLNEHKFIGVSSRTEANSKKQSQHLKLEKAYSSYEAALKDPNVDIIYNSLPNSLHAEWTLKALEAGKHVLCEKPLAMGSRDVEKIINLSQKNNLTVMEGLMYRHHGQMDFLKSLLKDIGPIHTLKMSFHTILPAGENIRWSKDLGGGALWDLGCYVIHCLRTLMASEPTKLIGRAQFKNEVDEFFWGQLEFPCGAQAFFDIGFNNVRRETLEIIGQNAVVLVAHPIKATQHEEIQILKGRQDIEHRVFEHTEDPYKAQLLNFIESIKKQSTPKITLHDSLSNTHCLEQLASAVSQSL
ncbi:MAG: Gfo/Idh/MocA family oxidoreductase [Proteobacteria bacterium]|nr:Gfo/Idh/MocA family oxidoreductase [Pseudomonadota bacterium]